MSENASATEITSQYTAQVTADLERNAKEQGRVGAEIADLQGQLAALERDHAVLVSIQQAIDTTARPSSDSVPLPAPRKKTPAKSRTRKPAQPQKTAAQPTRPDTKPADDKRAAKAEAASTAQPTLVDLVRRHLADQNEPRSAAEIATTLGQAHPERTVKTTVVRTTLEGLVAKAQAQRSKQGTSVFYTLADAPKSTAPAQTEEEPAPADA
ncbi:hypothetical protein OG562_43995 [Streptomyces sp. NBC_01275]|uniref:hypothetical protein n=1 Tax=Streptomyces sp. NBC_01275 TaxID=2903807 RepID=UPI0022540A7A|nr:hypothetical protein [Streptomyces sp. NBC_01275]MCX4767802.1 hypothetical protein [Streptomyces sp. NBC_01275]